MDRYPTNGAGNRTNNEDFGLYKPVIAQDHEDGHDYPKNRKRNPKKFDDLEETSFTRPTVQLQRSSKFKKKPSCLENSRCYFCEFCDNTSIHGFKFLGERRRYLIEKFWWFLIVCLALCGSGMLIYKTYDKWVTAPVIVTFATTETPIWKIPFPAVTICPEVNARPSIFNYTDVYLKYAEEANTTDEEDEYFDLFSLVCNARLDFVDENSTMTITEEDMDKFLDAFADVDAEYCLWQGQSIDCEESLSYLITTEGYCRTFNMLDPTEVYFDPSDFLDDHTLNNTKAQKWSLEEGYPQSDDLDTYPRRTLLAGAKAGFQIDLFVANEDLDYVCGDLQGFKVALHHPAEDPNMDNYFRVPLNQAVVAGIRPRMITTSDEIRAYSPEDRQCYLPGEKILTTYQVYSQQNCMFECLTNYTVEVCGCATFYMLSNMEFNSTPICGAGNKPCIERAKVHFLQQEIVSQMNHAKKGITKQCGCLPSCTSIEFDSETSQTDWDWRKTFYIRNHDPSFNSSFEQDHFSRLIVYYQDMQFMTSERHELYGTIDFLANCGGLLGLFWVWSGDSELIDAQEEKARQEEL